MDFLVGTKAFEISASIENLVFNPTTDFPLNHNYDKILKSDWLSTALISALIGQNASNSL